MRLVLLGPPGAGKGTQAKRLAAQLGVPAISTGDIFRANISQGTELGRLAAEYSHAGKLVPDEVTNQMVRDRLAQPDAADGFLLDGYPRTVDQAAALDEFLAASGQALDAVVELTVDPDALVERLLNRARIENRADDTEDVIRHRQEVYATQTAPLSRLYAERGNLVTVDGMGEIEEVTGRLFASLSVPGH